MMIRLILFGFLFLPALWISPVAGSSGETSAKEAIDLRGASRKIDELVEKKLVAEGVAPNPPISDDVFLRRAWLSIGGRIPTLAEAAAFRDSVDADKRRRLVRQLLDSEACVSHFSNRWADILRITYGLSKGRPASEDAYRLWLKKALRENTPYDEFVRQLITASGPWWEDGAVGYFIRDRGMPLDAMANTVRVFLGTRIECAQCHDHPFDQWTQMDFYRMAAFTHGTDGRLKYADRENYVHFFKWVRGLQADEFQEATGRVNFPQIQHSAQLAGYLKGPNYPKALRRLEMSEDEFLATAHRGIESWEKGKARYWRLRPVLDGLYKPLLYTAATEMRQDLKLPHDYQYADAAPHDVVAPRPMFGPEVGELGEEGSRIGAFADWLTSAENPAFTRTIGNRLWKEVFGYGLYEPIDEYSEMTVVSNPELLAYLEELMVELDYDLKAFLEVLFGTETWQRSVTVEPIVRGTPYHFPGPILRRMSAEQVWDSLMALTIGEVDEVRPRLAGQLGRLEFQRRTLEHLESLSKEEFITVLERLAEAYEENTAKRAAYRDQMMAARKAGDEERYTELGRKDYRERRMRGHVLWEIGWGEEGAVAREKARKIPTKLPMRIDVEVTRDQGLAQRSVPPLPEPPEGMSAAEQAAWKREMVRLQRAYRDATLGMARASELTSPAPRGHFLRDFGQSDRTEIENASVGASIPQALNLLNGPVTEAVASPYSVLGRQIREAESRDGIVDLVFQGVFTRPPDEWEKQLALAEFARSGDEATPANLIWALLNSRQFLFIR